MTSRVEQEFAGYRMSARAPRIAIVVRGDEHWEFWCRLALFQASQVWGGAGFVLVPHTSGHVHPAVLAGVVAYDPDYVVLQRRTVGDLEALAPGSIRLEDNDALSTDERAAIVARSADVDVRDPEGDEARLRVATACSPYRRWDADECGWDEHLLWWPDQDPVLTPARVVRALGQRIGLGVAPDLLGAAALTMAARVGYGDRPQVPSAGLHPTAADQVAAYRWCTSPTDILSAPLVRGPALAQASVFDVASAGLARVTVQGGRLPPALLAIGDTADDFALSLLWDRTFGSALWLPAAWTSGAAPESGVAQEALRRLAGWPRRQGPLVTSTSMPTDEVGDLLAEWRGLAPGAVDPVRTDAESLEWPAVGRSYLAVNGQFDQRFELPVRRAADGSRAMSTPPPLPLVTVPGLQQPAIDELKWQVDLEVEGSSMPRGRGFDAHALFVDPEDAWSTWLRSSFVGLSYNAHRFDLVLTGSSWSARLARPRVSDLALLPWAQALGAVQQRRFRHSDAGQRVQVLERMAGHRNRLVDLFTGPMLPALRAFQSTGRASRDAFPDGSGVRLADGGYLRFDAFVLRDPRTDSVEVRDDVDRLTATGILRRGVVLGCATCGRPSFVTVDDLRSTNSCPRCGARNDLTRERWRSPADELPWFYDLHPVARELFHQHGEVPLLAAAFLRASARTYSDVAELEMLSLTGNPLAEADLLAHVDGSVVVVEAKSNETLGPSSKELKAAAGKRAELARVLSADQVVLATTAPTWSPTSVEAMAHALTAAPWRIPKPPRLRLLTGLGTSSPSDHLVDP